MLMKQFIRLIRVPQWIKNLFVFMPLIFARHLFQQEYFIQAMLAFLAFCLISSTVYIINDLADIKSDRQHPVKKSRPIASGAISIRQAYLYSILMLTLASIVLSLTNSGFILLISAYFILNIFYSFLFKNIVILDIISIAAGFMLRVISGAFVIEVYVSSWLILTTMFVSLFLAIMKRHSELSFLGERKEIISRKVLAEYSLDFTKQIGSISAAGVIICYALYSVSERIALFSKGEALVYTTIFVVFGIFRFMYLVFQKGKGENATEIMLTDMPMIINTLLYIASAVYIIYF